MASTYPGTLDDFATTSPANLGTTDSTGRTHSQRHNDTESAIEAIETELGTDPAGSFATVKARIDTIGALQVSTMRLPAVNSYFGIPFSGPTHTTSTLGSSLAASLVVARLCPIIVPSSCGVDRMSVWVQTASDGDAVIEMGLYETDIVGTPTNRVAMTSQIPLTSTGEKTGTFTEVTLTPGLYYTAIHLLGTTATISPSFYAVVTPFIQKDSIPSTNQMANSDYIALNGTTSLPASSPSLGTQSGTSTVIRALPRRSS